MVTFTTSTVNLVFTHEIYFVCSQILIIELVSGGSIYTIFDPI